MIAASSVIKYRLDTLVVRSREVVKALRLFYFGCNSGFEGCSESRAIAYDFCCQKTDFIADLTQEYRREYKHDCLSSG